MKKLISPPTHPELKTIINSCLQLTNKALLEGDINTELSGSTVVGVAVYNDKAISFNIGDSRAIMISQVNAEKSELTKEGES